MDSQQISPHRRALDRAVLRGSLVAAHWVAHHWLVVVNTFFGTILLAGVLAPLALVLGFRDLSQALYDALKMVCHQMPSRSYFVFGEQMGFCERDVAIFASVALAGIAYAPIRHRVRPLPWLLTFLFMLPMAVDGLTQLFAWRESTPELRTITGALFGLGWVWCIYPWANIHLLRMDRQLHDEIDAAAMMGEMHPGWRL